MYCFRRAAFRALSSPSTSFVKPRSITTVTPSALRISRQIPSIAFQRRWASDEVRQDEPLSQEQETSSTGVYDGASLLSESEGGQSEGGNPGFRRTRMRSGEDRGRISKAPPSETIYIGNLFFDVTAEDLKSEMQRFGPIQTAKIVHDNRGLSRGFAYITFDTIEAAQKAVEEMHTQVFEGRRLAVQFASPRAVDAPRTASQPPSKTLFIGNMSFEMSDTDLNALFKEIRNVIDVRVAVDRRTGQPRGFAHADFVDVESAQEAFETLKTKSPYGRRLRLDYSYTNRGGPKGTESDSGSSSEGQ